MKDNYGLEVLESVLHSKKETLLNMQVLSERDHIDLSETVNEIVPQIKSLELAISTLENVADISYELLSLNKLVRDIYDDATIIEPEQYSESSTFIDKMVNDIEEFRKNR